MNGNNEWIENRVAEMLRDLRRSGFFDAAIAEAQHLHRTQGYVWDVALAIAWSYWAR
jgi:hypothetical protein